MEHTTMMDPQQQVASSTREGDQHEVLKKHYKFAYDLMVEDGDKEGAGRATDEYLRLVTGGRGGGSPNLLGDVAPLCTQMELAIVLNMCKGIGNEETFQRAKVRFYESLGLIPRGMNPDGTNNKNDSNSASNTTTKPAATCVHQGNAKPNVSVRAERPQDGAGNRNVKNRFSMVSIEERKEDELLINLLNKNKKARLDDDEMGVIPRKPRKRPPKIFKETNSTPNTTTKPAAACVHQGNANPHVAVRVESPQDANGNGENMSTITPTSQANSIERRDDAKLEEKNKQKALLSCISNTTLDGVKKMSRMGPKNDRDCVSSAEEDNVPLINLKTTKKPRLEMEVIPRKSQHPPKNLDVSDEQPTKMSSTNCTKSPISPGGSNDYNRGIIPSTHAKSKYGESKSKKRVAASFGIGGPTKRRVIFGWGIPETFLKGSATAAYYKMIEDCVSCVIRNNQHPTESQVVDLVLERIERRNLHFKEWVGDLRGNYMLKAVTSAYKIKKKIKASVKWRLDKAVEN